MGGGGVQRTVKFIKFLPAFGWESALCSSDDTSYWVRDESLLDEIPETTIIKRTRPLKLQLFFSLLEKIASREAANWARENIFIPDDRIVWALSTIYAALRLVKKHDVKLIYSTSPPHSIHLAALLLKKITGLPWVSDFRDPWTKNYLFKPRNRWVKSAHELMERKVFENSDRIICITELIKEEYREDSDIDPKRFVAIYNGYDPDDFPEANTRKADSVASRNRLVISHSGSLYSGNYPETFLSALARLLKDEPVLRKRMLFRFLGVMEEGMERRIKELLGENALFLGYLSHREAIEAVIRSDCNLIALPMDGKLSYHVAGKVFEYMASGRPILAVVPPGETADMVRSTRTGIVISEGDPAKLPESLNGAIIEIERMKEEGTFSPDVKAVGLFDRRGQAQMLAGIFDELTGGGRVT